MVSAKGAAYWLIVVSDPLGLATDSGYVLLFVSVVVRVMEPGCDRLLTHFLLVFFRTPVR